jgi:hypothetical protein
MIMYYSHDAGRSATPARLSVKVEVKVKVMLRPTVSRLVCLGFKPLLGPETRFLFLSDSCEFVALSDERTGLTLTVTAGPRQRSYSRVGVSRDS